MDPPDGGELGLADQLDYSTFHGNLEVPGTWELRNLGASELGDSLSGVPELSHPCIAGDDLKGFF